MKKEKEALIVNLFGGPSTGKSTTAGGVFNLLKLHDVDCELVTEFAKGLVWEERHRTFQNQHYLFGKQHHRVWLVKDKVDVVITDSPILLSAVYRPETLGQSFLADVVDTVRSFNNLNIFLKRIKKYNPNGRNETKEQALEVDLKTKSVLKELDMPFIEIDGTYEAANKVTEIILEKLGIKIRFNVREI